jgi:hypothetical protein
VKKFLIFGVRMVTIGVVKEVGFGKSFRTEKDVVVLKCEIDDPNDVQTVEYHFATGQNSLPRVDDTVLIHEVSNEYKIATATNTGVVVTIEDGESSIFAIDGENVASVIRMLKSGEIELNNGEGYAVEFGELKTAFDQLKDDYNKLVTQISTTWVPVPNDGGAALKTLVAGDNPTSSADIAPAKVEEVRI